MAGLPLLVIDELHVSNAAGAAEPGVEILDGVSLTVQAGESHALLGPSGPGTSALAAALLGSPAYEVTSGRILLRGDDITDWATDVRAKAGLFLAFPQPQEISGVSLLSFLRHALSARKGVEMSVLELRLSLLQWLDRLGIDPTFMERPVNEGRSEGDRKLNEVLQMAVMESEMVVLDETGNGLDVEAWQTVATGLQAVRAERPALGTLTITHHQRLLDHLSPDRTHILVDGRIVASGGPELARQLETEGYESFT